VEGETKPLYCATHKLDGMVNVISKTCIHPNCRVQPFYNVAGESKALYCATHKLDGMVNIKDKTCIYPNCKTRPIYNVRGETPALYCATHKLDGMVNVKDKTCIHPNCKTLPAYNVEGVTKALYCATHKLDGMVNVKCTTCIHPNCKTIPTYNAEGESKALYCSQHKKEEMVNVKDKTCKNEWCFTLVAEKYDGYCLYCFKNLFPDKVISRNYKTKEYAVVEYVKQSFQNYTWITDKKIYDGCSKRRPDLWLDLGYQILIVEVDENQHIDYDCTCENKRIMELSKDVGHRPIIFIRFNPDDYKKNGTNITSCWSLTKKGICELKKSKKDEWLERLNILKENVNYWINNNTNKTVEIIELFYDMLK
jgi:hypothetical protein